MPHADAFGQHCMLLSAQGTERAHVKLLAIESEARGLLGCPRLGWGSSPLLQWQERSQWVLRWCWHSFSFHRCKEIAGACSCLWHGLRGLSQGC